MKTICLQADRKILFFSFYKVMSQFKDFEQGTGSKGSKANIVKLCYALERKRLAVLISLKIC
jgi:hypothetical protein